MSIIASDPVMQKASDAIVGMDPASALQYLAQHGLNQGLAIGVLEAAQLKQAAKTQQAIQGVMGPQPNVLQQTHQAFQQLPQQAAQQAVQQHAVDQARQGGIANLPVGPNMFGPKMAKGGIVAFAAGGPGGIGGEQIGLLAEDAAAPAAYAADSAEEILKRAAAARAASYANAGIAAPSAVARSPYAVDSTEEILKRAAASRGAGAAAAAAAPTAAKATPGLLSRGLAALGPIGRFLTGPTAFAVEGLTHSAPGVSQDEENAILDKHRQQVTTQQATNAVVNPATPAAPKVPVSHHANNVLTLSGLGINEGDDPTSAALDSIVADAKTKADRTPGQRLADERLALGSNTALEDYSKELDTQKGMAKLNAESQMRMARAAAFFNMGMAAGQPGQAGNALTKFLNAANVGGASYSQAIPHIQQGLFAAQQKIAEDKFRIADAQRREDSELLRDATREYGADQRNYSSIVGSLAQFKAKEHGDNIRALLTERGLDKRSEQYNATIEAAAIRADSSERAKFIQYGMVGADQRLSQTSKALQQGRLMYGKDPDKMKALEDDYNQAFAEYGAWYHAALHHAGIAAPVPGAQNQDFSHLWKPRS
jgi:hypothetical protein